MCMGNRRLVEGCNYLSNFCKEKKITELCSVEHFNHRKAQTWTSTQQLKGENNQKQSKPSKQWHIKSNSHITLLITRIQDILILKLILKRNTLPIFHLKADLVHSIGMANSWRRKLYYSSSGLGASLISSVPSSCRLKQTMRRLD